MARKKMSNLERAQNFLAKNGSASHKQIVKHLLKVNGWPYNERTRKRYDKLFYGENAPLAGIACTDAFGNWQLVSPLFF